MDKFIGGAPTVVIPMSGVGSRFLKQGYDANKALLPLLDRRIVDWVISMYPADWDIILGISTELIESNPNLASSFESKVKIVKVRPHKKGPVETVAACLEECGDGPIFINYVDFWSSWNPFSALNAIQEGFDLALTFYSGFHPHKYGHTRYGYLSLEGNVVSRISEKIPLTQNHLEEPASSGVYVFKDKKFLNQLVRDVLETPALKVNGEFYVSALVQKALESEAICKGLEDRYFLQLGTPEHYEDVKRYLEFMESRETMNLRTELGVGQNSIVLAAGASKRFFEVGYMTNKSCLPLFDSTMIQEAAIGLPQAAVLGSGNNREQLLQTLSPEMAEEMLVIERTQSHLESAAYAASFHTESENLIFAPCDSQVTPHTMLDDEPCSSWAGVIKPFNYMYEMPDQYGWVRVNNETQVIERVPWELAAQEEGAMVMTGHFLACNSVGVLRFYSRANPLARELKLDDWFFDLTRQSPALTKLKELRAIVTGTPYEYETAQYFFFAHHRMKHCEKVSGPSECRVCSLEERRGPTPLNYLGIPE